MSQIKHLAEKVQCTEFLGKPMGSFARVVGPSVRLYLEPHAWHRDPNEGVRQLACARYWPSLALLDSFRSSLLKARGDPGRSVRDEDFPMTAQKQSATKKPMTIDITDPDSTRGTQKAIGGSQSDHWNLLLVKQAYVLDCIALRRNPRSSFKEECHSHCFMSLTPSSVHNQLKSYVAIGSSRP